MAAQTLTYTANMAENCRAPHIGVNVINFEFNSGATAFGTACDVVLLGKLPAHCTVLPGSVINAGTKGTAAHFVLLAVDANDFSKSGGTVYGSFTMSATAAKYTIDRAVKVSLSADSTATHAVLYCNCTTGTDDSASVSLAGSIFYVADGRAL